MRVLLATDGSREATRATRWLAALAPAADVLVLSVASVPHSPLDRAAMRDLREESRARAVRVCARARARLAAAGARATTRVVDGGDPREEIVRVARQWAADLLVLGARRRGRLAGLLEGSVAPWVAGRAPYPLLVCRGRPRPIRRALVAAQGSRDALGAARVLARIAPRGVRARVLGIVERPSGRAIPARLVRAWAAPARPARETPEGAALARALAPVVRALAARGARVRLTIARGRPAETIVAAARRDRADVVALGARGRSTVARLLLGSVSQAVLRRTPCSALIVRGARAVRRAARGRARARIVRGAAAA
jgi:nucleotide-binding universal stress UspA family protein